MRRIAVFSVFRVASYRGASNAYNGTAEEFAQRISKGSHVVDFHTTWCGPCKAIAPQFESLANSNPNIGFMKIDLDENEEIGALHDIRSIPTFLAFREGKVVARLEGADKSKLAELVQKAQ